MIMQKPGKPDKGGVRTATVAAFIEQLETAAQVVGEQNAIGVPLFVVIPPVIVGSDALLFQVEMVRMGDIAGVPSIMFYATDTGQKVGKPKIVNPPVQPSCDN